MSDVTEGIEVKKKATQEITPHTLRLLRLITSNSSAEHTRQAISILSKVASRSHPIILWDILARLYTSLTLPDEGDALGEGVGRRENVALAMEHVARFIPLGDQKSFLKDCFAGNEKEGTNDEVEEVTSKDSCAPKDTSGQKQEDGREWIKIQDFCDSSLLSLVLERGRLLLSCSDSQFSMNSNNLEDDEYNRENQMLHNLDLSAPSSNTQDYLRERISLQRSILARRLGFGGILSSSIVQNNHEGNLNDIIKDEDLVKSSESSMRTSNMSARERNMKRLQKRKKVDNTNALKTKKAKLIEDRDEEDDEDDSTIRKLILLSLGEYSKEEGYSSRIFLSQRNPQTLLATDLLYHSFHPSWHIRHGSLLGLSALLRSWRSRVEDAEERKTRSHNDEKGPSSFGKWPQDILARCICVLALDRFGDYSGPVIEMDQSKKRKVAALAPVREVAAQVLSFLLVMAPLNVQTACIEVLQSLTQCDSAWEVRHGAILAFKYISDLNIDLMTFWKSIPTIVIQGLCDDNDDVRGASAQTISHILTSDKSHAREKNLLQERIEEMCRSCSYPVWKSLREVHVSSSCCLELLHCLCNLIEYDCGLFLQMIRSHAHESNLSPMEELLQKLCAILSFESASVRLFCLKTLSLIIEPITHYILKINGADEDNNGQCESIRGVLQVYSNILYALFQSFFSDVHLMSENEGKMQHGEKDRLGHEEETTDIFTISQSAREKTWQSLVDSINCMIQHKKTSDDSRNDILCDTVLNLLLTLVKVTLTQYSSRCWVYKITSKLSNQYRCLSSATNAFVMLCKSVANINRIESYLIITISTLLKSPWPEQCELGSILIGALANQGDKTFPSLFERCKPILIKAIESMPTCLQIDSNSTIEAIRSEASIQNICFSAMETILQKYGKLHKSQNVIVDSNISTITKIWSDAFRRYNINLYDGIGGLQISPSSTSMRLLSTNCHAVISIGQDCLPSKLTPIIRALVTLIKNEESHSRSNTACCAIVQLILILQKSDDEQHSKIWKKIVTNMCGMACIHRLSDNIPKGYTRRGCRQAKIVIQMLIAQTSAAHTLQEIAPLWSRLNPLNCQVSANQSDADIMKAIVLMESISLSLKKDTKMCSHASSMMLPPITLLACTSPIAICRQVSVNIASKLCEIDTRNTMPIILPLLLKYLRSSGDDPSRLGACRLLNTIVRSLDTALCQYVRYLIPVVMSMMIDPLKQCADLSASTFSRLVRVAPLVQTESKSADTLPALLSDGWNESCSVKVIDHLILGKPLPQYKIPKVIDDVIRGKGVILRQYQIDGIAWLLFLKSLKLNGCLCDDMGLGKTIQALLGIAIAHNHVGNMDNKRPKSLVVCPSSVTGEWVNEVNKIGLGKHILKVLRYFGPLRKEHWKSSYENCDIVITSYSILRSDIDTLKKIDWTYCVLDEGHLLKNPKTLTAKAARQIACQHKLILSGTPVQNKVHELWASFDWIMPNYLGTNSDFSAQYAKIISKGHLPGASSKEIRHGLQKLKQLHQQVLPFILRRDKAQVLKELPPKTIIDIPCSMTQEQLRLYADVSARKGTQAALQEVDAAINCGEVDSSLKKSTQSNAKLGTEALKSLLSLRLICTHPLLIKKGLFDVDKNANKNYTNYHFGSSGKFCALNDLLRRAQIFDEEATAADNDDSIFYVDDTDINERPVDTLHQTSDDDIFEQGGIRDEKANTSKCLIFAQYIHSLDLVERLILKPLMPSLRYVRLDGRTPQKDRSNVIEAFQSDDSIKCMLLTSKVGSLGLNLQAADTVIFLESDWNPFVDLQAQDRVHRIGQRKNVQVYRFVTSNSIEEKIMAIQRIKIEMSKAIINTENSTMFSMGTDRLLDLFTTTDNNETIDDRQCEDIHLTKRSKMSK